MENVDITFLYLGQDSYVCNIGRDVFLQYSNTINVYKQLCNSPCGYYDINNISYKD